MKNYHGPKPFQLSPLKELNEVKQGKKRYFFAAAFILVVIVTFILSKS